MVLHRLDVLHYLMRKKAIGEDEEARESVDTALDMYIEPDALDSAGGWCQSIMHMHIERWPLDDLDGFLDDKSDEAVRNTKRRRRGKECKRWFGTDRRLDKNDMLDELDKLRRGEYNYLIRGLQPGSTERSMDTTE